MSIAKEKEEKEIEELRRFLIQRFILVLVLAGILEYGVMLLINRLLFPFMQRYFFIDVYWGDSLSSTQMLLMTILWLLGILLMQIGNVLPAAAQTMVAQFVRSLGNFGVSVIPGLEETPALVPMDGWTRLVFLFFLLAIVVLTLAPYVIAVAWYSYITVREIQKLEKQREIRRKDYEKRRNLMFSDIAHDLRTPITTVAGYAKALADGMITDKGKQQEYLMAIQTKSARMNELIQLLFEYVKLDSDGFVLERKTLDLSELLRENAALMYSDIEEAQMELLVEIPEGPCRIYADELQMSRTFTNLLTNAIRHNPPGTRILLSMKEEEGRVLVTVADTGENIPQELAEHLFEPFAVGDNSRSTNGGSGLGLSIAHKVVEMHGWKLDFTSVIPGYTKAFYIEIL